MQQLVVPHSVLDILVFHIQDGIVQGMMDHHIAICIEDDMELLPIPFPLQVLNLQG
jgi:hypothetical protein